MSLPISRIIEWRADRIHDPVERLRYLRQASRTSSQLERIRFRPRVWQMATVGVLIATMLISAFTLTRQGNVQAAFPDHFAAEGGLQVMPKVWLVETKQDSEIYSNGLRIENKFAVDGEKRGSYPVFARRNANAVPVEWRSQPSGIVFHTTETLQFPFEQGQTHEIQRVGGGVMEFTRRNHAYHFVIDKFGQVFRIVRENGAANHSGFSIWGDERYAFVNLNAAFLGVAFETQTEHDQEIPSATSAQVHSARVLTEMLRSKYQISASDCVTHAQVSVNPSNLLIGYHTDWAGNFPFAEIGLGDNYLEPPAAIDTFGFTYDSHFVNATGSRFWHGLILADEQVRAQAISQGLPPVQYRKLLQNKYKEILAAVRNGAASKETSNEK